MGAQQAAANVAKKVVAADVARKVGQAKKLSEKATQLAKKAANLSPQKAAKAAVQANKLSQQAQADASSAKEEATENPHAALDKEVIREKSKAQAAEGALEAARLLIIWRSALPQGRKL